MPPKKRAGGPVEAAAAKSAPRKNVGISIYLVKARTYSFPRLENLRKSQQKSQWQMKLQNVNARERKLSLKSRRILLGTMMYTIQPPTSCTALILTQGFAALLEPFYSGKSLTDPINTAEVRKP
jgi:hypothetical protein